jgi:hypothetical protein
MCNTLRVQWTIIPRNPPQPLIACSGCASYTLFRSSGKLRLNANGKKLDAWLIYKCVNCDKTWNRALFERRSVKDIDPVTLEALQSNNPDWIRRHAFDTDALKRKCQRIEEFAEIDIHKKIISPAEHGERMEISLSISAPTCLRLDRLLATELNISRSRLQMLYETGTLKIDPQQKGVLRRRLKDGLRAVLDLSAEPDREALMRSACGVAGTG